MSRTAPEWIATRRNWTRPQQKTRIMLWFKVRAEKGNFARATAQQIANGLKIISAQMIKEICEEMVLDRELSVDSVVHRVRKDGSQITKSLYMPYCMDEWRNAWLEEQASYGMKQMWLFDQ